MIFLEVFQNLIILIKSLKLYNIHIPSLSTLQMVNKKQQHENNYNNTSTSTSNTKHKQLTINDLTKETIQMINNYYYNDFILFNYTML